MMPCSHNSPMYVVASQLKNLPVLSLQTGQPLGTVVRPLVKRSSLEIAALICEATGIRRQTSVIMMRDVRQVAGDCIIIDSFEDIEDAREIVRLRDVVEDNFNPMGKLVVTEAKHQLGRVEDYTINLETYMLQKLYVQQSMLKSILFNSLVIDRTQITDIGPKQFTVRDATEPDVSLAPQPAPAK